MSWPFKQPENLAVLAARQVLDGTSPILLVCHLDGGDWQFLSGDPVTMADALLVALRVVYQVDATLADLRDLPQGWQAQRAAVGQPWRRTLV